MSSFRFDHRPLLRGLNGTFRRYLYDRIAWNRRVVGIIGQEGSGKTTLLLQRIKLQFGESEKACYLSLDNFWFLRQTLSRTVTDFCKKGGTHLFLDQVQAYPDWQKECGKLIAAYPELQVVFAASPVLSAEEVEEKWSGEAVCYRLHTLSFREYLSYESVLDMPPVPLDDLVGRHAAWVKEINSRINVVPLFRNYLEHGCYPFYWQDPAAFSQRLQRGLRQAMEVDLASSASLSQAGVVRMKKLLVAAVAASPALPRSSEMTRSTGLPYSQQDTYLDYLQQLGYLRLPDMPGTADSDSPEKRVFAGNPNILTALSEAAPDRRLLAETFFLDQLSAGGHVRLLANQDFLVNDRYTFRVGDPLRDYESIKNQENTFAAIYGLPRSLLNRMPVWLLGFCY